MEEVAASLRERIKHLDDMVHCQQKKVKHMVEEVRSSKTILSLLGTLILLVHNRKRSLFCVQFPYATLVTNRMEASGATEAERLGESSLMQWLWVIYCDL